MIATRVDGAPCRAWLPSRCGRRGDPGVLSAASRRRWRSRPSTCAPTPPRSTSPTAVERHRTEADRIQVSTAPGPDGIVRRMERARARGQHQLGGVRARQFRRRADRPADRRAALPHGRLGPVLARSRPVARRHHHAELGRAPRAAGQRRPPTSSASRSIPARSSPTSLELRTDKLPQLYLWEPDAYKDKVNSFTLYHGIVIGIAGLLALFLTILFVVKGSVMFPAAAALGWAVLVYIGIDFGFWGKVFDMSAGAERIWRASGEAILAATLLVFLFAYLNLNRWHVRYAHITHRLARGPRPRWSRSRCSIRRSPRASRGCRCSRVAVARLRPRDLSLHPRLRPRGAADPDLVPAGGLDDRGRR